MEQRLLNKKEVVGFFLKKGFLLSHDILNNIQQEKDFDEIYKHLLNQNTKEISVLTQDTKKILGVGKNPDVNWVEFDKLKVLSEKGKNIKNYNEFIKYFLSEIPNDREKEEQQADVRILCTYDEEPKKREAQDFANHFYIRFTKLEKILRKRTELRNVMSINRILVKKDRENISIIGMINEKKTTKNNNLMLTLEDKTGQIKVIVNKNKPMLHNLAKELVLDDVVAVTGVNGDNIIFANNLMLPDIPNTTEVKKSADEVYALFISDMHVGSIDFLEDDFIKFLKWINREIGSEEQKKIAAKVKYIFLIGDLVDGCGVYPGQDKELLIKDIKDQYKECARFLENIPKNIKLIICPGNHDAIRVAEPQPPMYKDFAGPIYDIPNSIIVSNPSLVNIHSSKDFPGFDVLLYHGYSFDYFVAQVESLRNNGGYNRADLIMKFLLQRRHLAPTHTSTLYVPEEDGDSLVIEKVPDFFVSGHIHKSITSNYRNVTTICSSCWQRKTAFQEKVGHNPEPSRVPVVNLKTREVKILKFGK